MLGLKLNHVSKRGPGGRVCLDFTAFKVAFEFVQPQLNVISFSEADSDSDTLIRHDSTILNMDWYIDS